MLQHTLPAGFIAPCLPSPAKRPPTGPQWIHEIKHDGYRMMARRKGTGVRLLTRNGHDWAPRYPQIIEAVAALRRSRTWLKLKNPMAPAVKREAEEDWGRR
jgi:ATP-dependent DNA ligase